MNEAIAYYDPSSRRMVINSDYANSPDFLLREYAHRALIYTGSPFTGPDADKDWRYISLESGLASYFPCSFKAAPIFGGGGFVLDLSKHHMFGEIRPSNAYAVSDGMAVWGSSFWALRQMVGRSIADKLLWDSWFRLQGGKASAQYWQQYVHQLTRGYQAMGGTNVQQIIELFESRGLKL
jgi:hypothetical protein